MNTEQGRLGTFESETSCIELQYNHHHHHQDHHLASGSVSCVPFCNTSNGAALPLSLIHHLHNYHHHHNHRHHHHLHHQQRHHYH